MIVQRALQSQAVATAVSSYSRRAREPKRSLLELRIQADAEDIPRTKQWTTGADSDDMSVKGIVT